MASLQKEYNKEKRYGQVYTPLSIVEKVLDEVGLASPSILGKAILDPACGDGRFLIEVVKRIVKASHAEDLQKNLATVHGWDIDETAIEQCNENLNRIVEGLGIQIDWKISVRNALHQLPQRDIFSSGERENLTSSLAIRLTFAFNIWKKESESLFNNIMSFAKAAQPIVTSPSLNWLITY